MLARQKKWPVALERQLADAWVNPIIEDKKIIVMK